MGRPAKTTSLKQQPKRRKDARPTELLQAALEEFALHGFARTRLEDVAARAGVVKGTIYRYFADKEALFLATFRERFTPYMSPIGDRISSFEGTTKELLVLTIRSIYEEIVDSDLRVLMRIVIAESDQFPALAEFYHREAIAHGRQMLGRIVERGVARGEIRKHHAPLLPTVLVGPAIMAAVWKMAFEPFAPITTAEFLEAHLDWVTHGLFEPEPVAQPTRRKGRAKRP